MTIQEMYQEMHDQNDQDNMNNNDHELNYDDNSILIELEMDYSISY
jgi:hypothetical protein